MKIYNNKSILTFLNSSTLGTRALLMTLRLYLVPYGKNEHCLWNEEEDESRRWRIQINSLHLLICTFINLYYSCRTMSISFKLHLYIYIYHVLHPYLPTMGGRAHWGAQIFKLTWLSKNATWKCHLLRNTSSHWQLLDRLKGVLTVARAGVLKESVFHALAFFQKWGDLISRFKHKKLLTYYRLLRRLLL